jgi:hypothetical protein
VKILDSIHFDWRMDEHSQTASLPSSENQLDSEIKSNRSVEKNDKKSFDDIWHESKSLFNSSFSFPGLAELTEFVKYEGHFNPPRNSSVRNWVHYQRRLNRQGKLPENRVKLLDAISFPWESINHPKTEQSSPEEDFEDDEDSVFFHK